MTSFLFRSCFSASAGKARSARRLFEIFAVRWSVERQRLIITTSSFTSDARREATRDGAPAIDLIDGEMLCQLLKERNLGLIVRMVEQVELIEAFFQTV